MLRDERPDLTLVYLPHLDYDPQRFGPSGCDMPRLVRELDDACAPLLDAGPSAPGRGSGWSASTATATSSRAVLPNRVLRRPACCRSGPARSARSSTRSASRAFAVCDHQLAHVYVPRPGRHRRASATCSPPSPGVARVLAGEERAEIGLDHPRSGEMVALSEPDAWFAYPFWLDDRPAPDYARTVDIHRKPGYDPCELFFDPTLPGPKAARSAG